MVKQVFPFLLLMCIVIVSSCGLLGRDNEVTFKNPIYANVFLRKPTPMGLPYRALWLLIMTIPKSLNSLPATPPPTTICGYLPMGKTGLYR